MISKTGLRIAACGRALPGGCYSNNDLKQYMDTDDEWIYSRTGIRTRYYCDPENEDTVTLAAAAAAAALDSAEKNIEGFDKDSIGAVIATSCSSGFVLPSIAAMVQHKLGIKREVLSFDLNAACSGFVFGLITGRALLMSGDFRYVLLVSAEQLSRELDLTDRGTGILFGDGAGAALIELDKDENAAAFTAKAWSDGNSETLSCSAYAGGTLAKGSSLERRKQLIEMNGHDVFRFAVAAVPQTIDGLLKDSGMSMDDIDIVICHQANARIIDHVKRRYKGQEHKFLMNIEKYGNTSSASIPILLSELTEQGRIRRGMRIMCVGFGAGLAWGGAIVNT